MSFLDDVVAGGVLPLQHFDRKYEIPLRLVKFAGRHEGKDPVGKDAPLQATEGDLLGGILWPHNPALPAGTASGSSTTKTKREIPAWGLNFPAVATAASRQTGRIHRVKVKPIGDDALNEDPRFLDLEVLTPSSVSQGTAGVVLAVTEEYEQILVFLPSASALVAPHFGRPGSAGTLVHDVDANGKLDLARKATLQHLTRVHEIPTACAPIYGTPLEHGLALQFDVARDGQLGGLFADGPGPVQRLAHLGKKSGGPLFSGFPGDKHDHGSNSDGESYGPGHLPSGFLVAKDPLRDGPVDWSDELVTEYNVLPGVDVQTRFVFNPLVKHPTPCGPKDGIWQAATRVPQYWDREWPTDGGGGGGGGNRPDGWIRGGGGRGDGTRPLPGDPRGIPEPPNPRPDPFPDPTDVGAENPGGTSLEDLDPVEAWNPGGTSEPAEPQPWDGPANDECKRGSMATLSEFSFPAISYQAANLRKDSPEYLYSNWSATHAAIERRRRPTVLRTEVVGLNVGGFPTVTSRAPCPYPGGTSDGLIVDLPPEVGLRELFDGYVPKETSRSGRSACKTFTAWGCPDETGVIEDGFTAELDGDGKLIIDHVTGGESDETATLEIDPVGGTITFNGTELGSGGGSTDLMFGDAEDDGVYV